MKKKVCPRFEREVKKYKVAERLEAKNSRYVIYLNITGSVVVGQNVLTYH